MWGDHHPLPVPGAGQALPGPVAPAGAGWVQDGCRMAPLQPSPVFADASRCTLCLGNRHAYSLGDSQLLRNVPSSARHKSQLLGLGTYILICPFYVMECVNNSKGAFHPILAVTFPGWGGPPARRGQPC